MYQVLHAHQKTAQGWTQRITELHKKYSALYHDYLADEEQEETTDKQNLQSKEEDEEMEEEEAEEEEEAKEEAEEGEEGEEDEDEDEKRSTKRTKKTATLKKTKKPQATAKSGSVKKKKSAKGTLPVLSADELRKLSPEELEVSVGRRQDELQALRPNLQALKQYREKQREYELRAKDLAQITEERDRQRALYDSLRKKRLDMFMEGFTQITMKLKEMYQMITIGGDAELEVPLRPSVNSYRAGF